MPSAPSPQTSALLAGPAAALPLPEPGWGLEAALAAVEQARAHLPVVVGPVDEVLGLLTTVVLGAGQHVLKVYPPGTDESHLDGIHTALAGSRTAACAVVPAVPTAYGVVTAARRVPSLRPVSWPEVGSVLRAFHEEHATAQVAQWAPLSRLESQVSALPAEQAEVLRSARDLLLVELSRTRSQLGPGVIHGDVSPSNVLQDSRAATLIDLDWVARGPREYDLTSASRRFRAGELDRRTYRDFCAAYGHDVLTWDGLELVDRIADLAGVVFRVWDCRHHGRDLDWLDAEVRLWRTPV
jgi:Ser/Thr protein kinase RdoA (MazF antagonist)